MKIRNKILTVASSLMVVVVVITLIILFNERLKRNNYFVAAALNDSIKVKELIAKGQNIKELYHGNPVSIFEISKEDSFPYFSVWKDICFDSYNALDVAIFNRKPEMVKLLIDSGADLEKGDLIGQTPLFRAVIEDNIDLIKCLIKAGANVNCKRNTDGSTPLFWTKSVEAMKLLLDNGADIKIRNAFGNTSLSSYDTIHSENKVVCLLERGAEVNVVGQDGKSILDEAVYYCITPEDNKVVELLKTHGAKTAAELKAGQTPPASDIKGAKDAPYPPAMTYSIFRTF